MLIRSLRVRNYRCILDESLSCDELTALVGPNGSGKSSFINALDLFYSPAPRVSIDDFYAKDAGRDIEIEVTFYRLSTKATELFGTYMQGDELTVVRVISLDDGRVDAKYHGSSLQLPEFAAVRALEKAGAQKGPYGEVRTAHPELPAWTNQQAALDAMASWEADAANAATCVRMRDDGQFFGFGGVGRGYLGKFTRWILVPAVREAGEDATEGKGSVISELMDLVVRTTLSRRKEIQDLRARTNADYKTLMDPANLTELETLRTDLSATLATYAPGAGVAISWQATGDIEVPLPKADLRLVEDGFESSVARTGHGLQRSFILTMLQHLAKARSTAATVPDPTGAEIGVDTPNGTTAELPDLVLAIEEPELYQHPNRQRHLARVLLDLASGVLPGVAGNTQVLYTTHSPLFVGIDRFDQVRRVRKERLETNQPKITRVASTSLDLVAAELHRAAATGGAPFTGATLRPRLQALMTPWMNEGFFADVVVLVEGEDDRAAILGQALADDVSLESEGIAVIPCLGKCSLDRPHVVFSQLGLPVYVIWDSDQGAGPQSQEANKATNKGLLRLVNEELEDWPHFVHAKAACFIDDLEATIEREIGSEAYLRLLSAEQVRFGFPKRAQAQKNPTVVQAVIAGARAEGRESTTLRTIVERILALRSAAA
jgi:predicted ATPase